MRCDTQRDVYVIERFRGLDMPKAMKNGKVVGWSQARGQQNFHPSNKIVDEKDMRKGRHAFPHLRDFYSQKELKGETLFDNFMSAITTNRKHLWCNYKDKLVRQRLAGIAVNLRSADRFVIAGDLQKNIANVSFEATDEKIFDIINNAIPPFDNMWIETEKNPLSFRVEGGGDGYLEQVGWHIQRAGSFLADSVITKANENIIVITKYIKFSKIQNPSSLSKNMGIEEKMEKMPHDSCGCYYISDLSILVGNHSIPNELIASGWLHLKNQIPNFVENGNHPLKPLGDKWLDTITNGQAHIKNNLMGRFGVTHSYAMDLAHHLAWGHDYNKPLATHKLDRRRALEFYGTSYGHYEDDLRILAWALSDFNYNWIFKKPATKPTRRNRSKPFRQATIETRTLEIELPKPRGKEMDEHQFGDGTPRKWHKVRGHWRYYKKTGYRVWIENYERGDKKLGEVHKDYKLKHKK